MARRKLDFEVDNLGTLLNKIDLNFGEIYTKDDTQDRAIRDLTNTCNHLAELINTGGGGSGESIQLQVIPIVIPSAAENWVDDEDTNGDSPIHCDVAVEGVTAEQVPMLIVLPDGMGIAIDCGLSSYSQTLEGILRVYSAEAPRSDISCGLVIIGAVGTGGGGSPSGGGQYVLPVATATTLGGVKIGDGVDVAADGTISANSKLSPEQIATDSEIEEMLTEVFGNPEPQSNE